jgi:hypothetical protein
MAKIHAGRHSAELDGDFVVFLIGMRLNRPWRFRHIPWFMRTMPRMLKELEADPEAGMLGGHGMLLYGGIAYLQYWRSFAHLERYARNADAQHLPAWREFNRRIRGSGDIGIWHETYKVRAGEYEAIYGNMPRVGLGAVGRHMPLGATSTAARRIAERLDDEAPIEAY